MQGFNRKAAYVVIFMETVRGCKGGGDGARVLSAEGAELMDPPHILRDREEIEMTELFRGRSF